ncbi:MAG TPA: MarR family transcriptional regulator [Kiritimatiellia bacterium]|nr:MarR family transcriptional regulator [Kiritimatiellia bacterium]HRZ13201.1 MarR family transcriptional regulator [Kiritimatiellia bacterium]HSA19719.1 MarR family transcriptional regulator [Kiritimatiellia bacterium]
MTSSQDADRLMELLPKLMRGIHAYERNFFTCENITFPQLWALDFVHEHPRCTMHQLATAMHSRQSTATGLVDRMQRLNLVRRERRRSDRRVVCVSLSEKGRSMVRQITDQRRRMIRRLFSRMSERDRRQYLDILGRLVEQFSEPARARTGGHP